MSLPAYPSALQRLGWDDHFNSSAQQIIIQNASLKDSQPGRIGRVDRGACAVFTSDGLITATSNSQISQDALSPVTGDWVLVSHEDGMGWVIDSILPRRAELVRRDPALEVSEQAIVSNVDVVGVVHGLDRELRPAQLERMLVAAVNSGASPVVVLNKADLVAAPELSYLEQQVRSIAPNVAVAATCVVGEVRGLELLEAQVGSSQTLVLIGMSGVGKSSIARALLGRGDSQSHETDELIKSIKVAMSDPASEATQRGQHTTVARDLFLLPNGGVIIDTPGLRAVGLWAADAALDEVFSDISELAESCRFRDCTHRLEPDCAVLVGVAEGSISQERLERYLRLWEELANLTQEREEHDRRASRGRHRQQADKKVRKKRRKAD